MTNKTETVREVCAEMREYCDGRRQPYDTVMQTCANRIERIYEREMAAKDDAHRQWRKNYHDRLAAKDAEIAQLVTKCNRLMAALNPVMEVHLNDGGTTPLSDSICAVREAQRIMKEGEVK